jgi:DNA-binding CsgD family transcriptional regulator
MRFKIYDDDVIAEIRRKYSNGATAQKLAVEYYVHENTIYGYCKGIVKRRTVR